MSEKKNKRPFDLPETKGFFQATGTITGMEKESMFKEIITKANLPMRFVKFGLNTSEENRLSLELSGMQQKFAYFGKRDPETKKYDTKKIPWAERLTFKEDGYQQYGANIGIEQYLDEQGKIQNKRVTKTDFDICEYIAQTLKDDTDVFVKGNLEFSSYEYNGATKRNTKFIPSQISAMKSPINFKDEKFKESNDFTQTIIFTGLDMDDLDPNDKKGLLQAKVISYNTIEHAEFVIRDKKLFSVLKKNLKPYSAIKVFGKIVNQAVTDEVEDNDAWGAPNPMDRTNKSYIKELVITGADKDSIDIDTYSEEAVESAVKTLKAFGETKEIKTDTSEDWGKAPKESEENWGDEEW